MGEVRGIGLMFGVELTGIDDASPIAAGARRRGVIVRATGQKIVMSPPLVIDRGHLDRIADALEEEIRDLPATVRGSA